MRIPEFRHLLTGGMLACATACLVQVAAAQSGRTAAAGFASSGAAACEKYLTPAVLSQLLTGHAGRPKIVSPQSCSVTSTDNAGSITITLVNSGAKNFDAYQKYLVNPKPLPGVGDRAVQSLIGITAFKAPNKGCNIDAGGAPGSLKLRGSALGAKLGVICNEIFAAAR